MNGNIFTDSIRYDLPDNVKCFFKEHNIEYYFKYEMNLLCPEQNKKNILSFLIQKYNLDLPANDFFENTDFDILILTNDNKNLDIFERIIGFVVTQKGFCKDSQNMFSQTPTIRCLHDTNKHYHRGVEYECHNMCKSIKDILIYIYIYSLKQKNIKYGLVSVRGLYKNVKELCLFDRFGFYEKIDLKSDFCFPEENELAMMCSIENVNLKYLEDILFKKRKNNNDPLCKNSSTEKIEKRTKNYKKMLKYQKGDISTNKMKKIVHSYNRKNNFRRLFNIKQKTKKDILRKFTDLSRRGFFFYKNKNNKKTRKNKRNKT